MEQFVDRDVELDQLTDCYESETADFIVIYGRRRLGNSEIIRQSIEDRDDAIYYQAMERQETGMALILVGSSISVMEDKVLSGGAPLYGRRTATIDLKPLDVADARQFFPEYDPETAITAWTIYGGTPYYHLGAVP